MHVWRPLLAYPKSEILAFAHKWVELLLPLHCSLFSSHFVQYTENTVQRLSALPIFLRTLWFHTGICTESNTLHPSSTLYYSSLLWLCRYGVPYFKDSTPSWSTRGKLRTQLMPLLLDMYGEGCARYRTVLWCTVRYVWCTPLSRGYHIIRLTFNNSIRPSTLLSPVMSCHVISHHITSHHVSPRYVLHIGVSGPSHRRAMNSQT